MDSKQFGMIVLSGAIALTLAITGCDRESSSARSGAPAAPTGKPSAAISNRIEIPDTVRRNLGISFAKVEMRPVAKTIRMPGKFELLPDARHEYRTLLEGRVELLVRQFQQVEPGTPLYRLDSPAWRELQQKLTEIEAQVREGEKRVEMIGPMREAHERHHHEIEQIVELLSARVARLHKGQETGSVSAKEIGQVQVSLAQARADLAEVLEKETELEVKRAEVTSQLYSARVRFDLLLNNAAMLLGMDKTRLAPTSVPAVNAQPIWRTQDHLEVAAGAPGYVESIAVTNGGWAAETSLVLTTIQPDRIRFHAHAMQSDLGRLRDDLPTRIVPPKSSSINLQETMEGKLVLGLSADSDQRTLDLYVTPAHIKTWARPGVAGHLEVTVAGGSSEMAIPLSAIIQDGLSKVLFRRDPKNPDKVIRITDPDLGIDDGRWVVVSSGVREGDEVVVDGVYQLMVATSGSIQKGGHFHADGTFHEGDE